jgi:glycosyltransferase involved in cell wall biosynthesis
MSGVATAKEPLVSVVTPVFNTEAHLAECIDSVLKQTYRNWEYVIVDNRSSDRSAAIAEEYTRKDKRIRLVRADVHLEQLPNYNRAMRLISASSVYTKIVQADDWILPECLERLVRVAETNPNVAVISCYLQQEHYVLGQGLPYSTPVVSGREACRLHLLKGQSLFGTPTSVLYRSDVVRARGVFFPESSLLGDTEACFQVLRERDFGFVHQVLAYCREQPDSYTSGILGYNPYVLANLILLRTYGRHFLTAQELEARWDTVWRHYSRFLGTRVLRRSDASFWDYHRRGWDAMGHRVTRADLIRFALRATVDLALNPKSTAERLVKAFRTRREQLASPVR